MAQATKIEWRVVPEFPDYEVSPDGGVRRATPGKGTYAGRELRTPLDSEGYPTVNLYGVPRRVHVLVAITYIGPVSPGGEVHHIDEDRSRSCLSNLEITTSRRAHQAYHRLESSRQRLEGEPNPVVNCACGCGTRFTRFDGYDRPRRYVSGHNPSMRSVA